MVRNLDVQGQSPDGRSRLQIRAASNPTDNDAQAVPKPAWPGSDAHIPKAGFLQPMSMMARLQGIINPRLKHLRDGEPGGGGL